MADWTLIIDLLHKADKGELGEFSNEISWCQVYNNGDGDDGDRILVIEGTKAYDALDEILKEVCTNIPVEDRYIYGEPYNGWYLDYVTDNNVAFSDEGFYCPHCDKWYRYDGYYNNYHIWDGEIACENCIREDEELMEDYIVDIMSTYDYFNDTHANTILTEDELENLGFEKVNEESYAAGLYDRYDRPSDILRKLFDDSETEIEVVFSVHKTFNPFETEYDVYVREVA